MDAIKFKFGNRKKSKEAILYFNHILWLSVLQNLVNIVWAKISTHSHFMKVVLMKITFTSQFRAKLYSLILSKSKTHFIFSLQRQQWPIISGFPINNHREAAAAARQVCLFPLYRVNFLLQLQFLFLLHTHPIVYTHTDTLKLN